MPDFSLENAISDPWVCGIDEAGCGPWAGPVVASAVLFVCQTLPDVLRNGIQDSKKLSPKKRQVVYEALIGACPSILTYGIAQASVNEIDTLGLARATRLAMERAVLLLKSKPQAALVDGVRMPVLPCPTVPVIKGDQRSLSIAAASILAKVYRDSLMDTLHTTYPMYGWNSNKGYGTADHGKAMDEHGLTPHHRVSFRPVAQRLVGQKER